MNDGTCGSTTRRECDTVFGIFRISESSLEGTTGRISFGGVCLEIKINTVHERCFGGISI